MVRMWGFLLSLRYGIAYFEQIKVPRALMLWMRSYLFTSISSTPAFWIADALLMRMSIPPKTSAALSIAALTLFSSLISTYSGKHFPPACSISFAAV